MKTIVVLTRREGAPAEAFARLHRAELMAVWDGVANGSVRAAYGLQEGAGAALELETGTVEEAKRLIDALPYVEEGMLDIRYYPLKPFVGFKDLFSSSSSQG